MPNMIGVCVNAVDHFDSFFNHCSLQSKLIKSMLKYHFATENDILNKNRPTTPSGLRPLSQDRPSRSSIPCKLPWLAECKLTKVNYSVVKERKI